MCLGSSPAPAAPTPAPAPPAPPPVLKQAAPKTAADTSSDTQAAAASGTKKYRTNSSLSIGTDSTGGTGLGTA